ncbi:hypothetical protein [Pelagibacterium mangrovi]|uniref:hypothetical protein n=1 Tax=Pelagibacterium mangrovi TaxID=3119828 RepID=UPI002FCBF56C
MTTIKRLRNEIKLAQEAVLALDTAADCGDTIEEMRPTLDEFLEHAALARLFSLYLGDASMDPAAVELRDLFREAADERLIDGMTDPRFGMGVFRIADERFEIDAISNALHKLGELLDREEGEGQ